MQYTVQYNTAAQHATHSSKKWYITVMHNAPILQSNMQHTVQYNTAAQQFYWEFISPVDTATAVPLPWSRFPGELQTRCCNRDRSGPEFLIFFSKDNLSMNQFSQSHDKTGFCLSHGIVPNTLFITVKMSLTLAKKNQFLNFMLFSNRDGGFASAIAEAPSWEYDTLTESYECPLNICKRR